MLAGTCRCDGLPREGGEEPGRAGRYVLPGIRIPGITNASRRSSMTSRKGRCLPALEVVGERSARLGVGRGLAVSQHPVPHDANEVVGNEPEDGERLSTQAVLDPGPGVLVPLRVEGPETVVLDPPVGADGGHALRWRESVHGQTGDGDRSSITGGTGLDDRRSLTPDLPVVAFHAVAQLRRSGRTRRCTRALLRTSWVSAIHPPGEGRIGALTHDHGQSPMQRARIALERGDVGDPRHRQHHEVLDGDEASIHRDALDHGTSIGSNQLPDEALEHRRFAAMRRDDHLMHGHLGGGGDVHGSEALTR